MSEVLRTISPVDGSVYVERPLAGAGDIDRALDRARAAQKSWRNTPIATRQDILRKAVAAFVAKKDEIAAEISWQMGRPISQAGGEVGGFNERATYMIDIAPEALGDYNPGDKAGFNRFIRREALGVVAIIAPWNFPYLTAVNGVIPALMAGNAVVLKHSHQTPLCAERFAEAFEAAGLPEGVFQYLHLSHADAEKLMGDARVDFVNFTGSVPGGHAVQRAVAGKFIATGLELGGKDPAYIRADVNLDHAVENVIDGAFFNTGQSCCGIERIYVHESRFDAFVEKSAALVAQYRLGSPIDPNTNLGPMVRTSSADFVRGQVNEAIRAGAKALIDPAKFAANAEGTPYLAPQILINVDHSMRVMSEESFGPVVGIMKVKTDEEAIALMNDSEFGLTASIWTADEDAALSIGDRLETGTVFMNRADYLDPALAWVGVKNSGRGCTLSKMAYEVLTRPKSFHLRTKI
ncbi:aldehyde dehydrogenase family protein [Thalassospira sp.]|uniref:aldehyde dehydrogenase family protein n=1 Tax=Thalassospira sp. TaxID=1912094 RepID=UPI002733324E|nr:aldehyde dehydrogenase family protein [Thalassospira sp.]MDP2698043.1 aldehyde dehydrogenase family protein [Thalassospira sp.]